MRTRKKPREWLVCIDPGKATGIAIFRKGSLVHCEKVTPDEFFEDNAIRLPWHATTTLVEIPRVYPQERSKAPPNDLIDTAQLAGMYQGYCLAKGAQVESVFPAGWKGTIPKPKKTKGQPRGTYIIEARSLEALSESEQHLIHQTRSGRAKYLDHNVIDAVGIGLWRLERRKNEASSIHRRANTHSKE